MNKTAIALHSSTARVLAAIGLGLIIFFLVTGNGRHAGVFVVLPLCISAGALVAILVIAQRERSTSRRIEAAIKRTEAKGEEQIAEVAEELARSTHRHIDTLDQMIAGCQIIDFNWRYLYLNDAAAGHGRKPKSELVGRTVMECYPGIENTAFFTAMERAMQERTREHMEHEFVYDDGLRGWFELSIHPAPEGIFIVSIDMTERKLAEINMRNQLDRLHSLRAIDLAILSTTDISFTLRTVLEEARARLRGQGACIRYFNDDSLMLETAATSGTTSRHDAVHISDDIIGRAGRERSTVAVADTVAQGVAPSLPAGVCAIYATPLLAKGQLIGVFTITFDTPFSADHDWIDYFETVAGQASMAIEAGRMFEELQRSHLDLRLAYDTTIEGWSRALDLRDKETEGHTLRVTDLCVKLARKAGVPSEEIQNVRWGALLHDIGKMGVPDHILLKPGPLTDEEWVLMRRHPTYAYELLRPIAYLRNALDIPYCHHEKWDGSGYPR
ncbi:MAG TPA: HD domain-containing phosphohydrolase, partial [Candidatus Krumholzibacteria bacterium]|nr:HD domain-containing phosphohydrolase [Candidatus Krumholzibacteria bacterium]